VMTPLRLAAGGTLFVNRGFVPESSASSFAQGGPVPGGTVAVSGLARISEPVTSFTPGTDFARRIEWVRNSERLAAMLPEELRPVAPVTLDLPAGPPGALPQAGETVMAFPNNHLGYALTWFGFAVLTPVLLGVWLLRQRRAV
jgi:surfeit locus 1 family protein